MNGEFHFKKIILIFRNTFRILLALNIAIFLNFCKDKCFAEDIGGDFASLTCPNDNKSGGSLKNSMVRGDEIRSSSTVTCASISSMKNSDFIVQFSYSSADSAYYHAPAVKKFYFFIKRKIDEKDEYALVLLPRAASEYGVTRKDSEKYSYSDLWESMGVDTSDDESTFQNVIIFNKPIFGNFYIVVMKNDAGSAIDKYTPKTVLFFLKYNNNQMDPQMIIVKKIVMNMYYESIDDDEIQSLSYDTISRLPRD